MVLRPQSSTVRRRGHPRRAVVLLWRNIPNLLTRDGREQRSSSGRTAARGPPSRAHGPSSQRPNTLPLLENATRGVGQGAGSQTRGAGFAWHLSLRRRCLAGSQRRFCSHKGLAVATRSRDGTTVAIEPERYDTLPPLPPLPSAPDVPGPVVAASSCVTPAVLPLASGAPLSPASTSRFSARVRLCSEHPVPQTPARISQLHRDTRAPLEAAFIWVR